jgi:hypothetical protein
MTRPPERRRSSKKEKNSTAWSFSRDRARRPKSLIESFTELEKITEGTGGRISMPLWGASVLFLISVVGTAVSFRMYFRTGGKKFLAAGIVTASLCAAALFYIAAGVLFVSSVE